jgi:hypothetical protein
LRWTLMPHYFLCLIPFYLQTSSSSDESDAETVNISLSMQSIDEFEASIRSTPPRQRRVLLNI